MGDKETLGARLLRARLEYGARLNPPRTVTQTEVGKELSVSGVAVGGWEADRNEPGLDKLRALAKLYGVRVGWLVDGEMPVRHPPTNGNPIPHEYTDHRKHGVSLPDNSQQAERRKKGGGKG